MGYLSCVKRHRAPTCRAVIALIPSASGAARSPWSSALSCLVSSTSTPHPSSAPPAAAPPPRSGQPARTWSNTSPWSFPPPGSCVPPFSTAGQARRFARRARPPLCVVTSGETRGMSSGRIEESHDGAWRGDHRIAPLPPGGGQGYLPGSWQRGARRSNGVGAPTTTRGTGRRPAAGERKHSWSG